MSIYNSQQAKQLETQITEFVKELAQRTDNVKASEFFKNYLEIISKIPHYSYHNQILILLQASAIGINPTRVMGYMQWKNFNRNVLSGEKGISILIPAFRYFDEESHKLEYDNETKSYYCPVCSRHFEMSEIKKAVIGFKTAHVFDISQTDGEPLQEIDISVNGENYGEFIEILKEFCSEHGIQVAFEKLSKEGLYGYSQGGRIVINNAENINSQVAVMVHEIAHELLHKEKNDLTRQQKEIQAEGVAYVVCKHFGLEAKSFNYLALYDADYKAIMENLSVVSSTSGNLIQYIKGKMAEKMIVAEM